MTTIDGTIETIRNVEKAVSIAVDDLRALDSLEPATARALNGAVDDMLISVQRVQAAMARLHQRSGGAPQIQEPQEANGIAFSK